jgi:amino acid transporter
MVFQCIVSLIMLSYDDLFALINYSSYVTSAFMAVSIAALLYLRITQPHLERPIKVSICPWWYMCNNFGGAREITRGQNLSHQMFQIFIHILDQFMFDLPVIGTKI